MTEQQAASQQQHDFTSTLFGINLCIKFITKILMQLSIVRNL
jgi:hypothetical protein